jgi:hypothetical protein
MFEIDQPVALCHRETPLRPIRSYNKYDLPAHLDLQGRTAEFIVIGVRLQRNEQPAGAQPLAKSQPRPGNVIR